MHVYIDACYGSVCSSCYRRTFRYLSMNVPIFIFGRCRLRDIAFCSCGIALSVVTGYPFCSYGISLSVVLGYIDFCNCYRCMFRHIYIDMHVQIYIYIYIRRCRLRDVGASRAHSQFRLGHYPFFFCRRKKK